MATARRFDFMRNANTKSIVLAVGLACTWTFSGAHAQQGCAKLNYDESRVGDYSVPDPLLGSDGKRITDPTSWRHQRRSETLQDFRDLMYGHTPESPIKLRGQVVAIRKDALDGLATRTIVNLHFFDDPKAPHIELMCYVPNKANRPVPMFLGLSFMGNASIDDDPAIGLPTGWMRPQQDVVVNNRQQVVASDGPHFKATWRSKGCVWL